MPHFACIKMAESYKYIFDCTLIHLSTLKGIFECYAESDFVYDLSLDNRNIKKKVMPPLHTLMDEVLRGTIYAALNKAVKLAKEGNDKEVDELFDAGRIFFSYYWLEVHEIEELKNYIKVHHTLPDLDEEDIIVHTW